MSIYSTIDFLLSEGETDGYRYGLKDGASRQTCKLLLRHGKHAFGLASPEQRDRFEKLAERLDLARLEEFRERLDAVASWADLLGEAEPPGERLLAEPDYLVPFEFDPRPMPASFDQYAKTTMMGREVVIHLRIQRLYQEDLGEILHRESQAVEAKYRCPVLCLVILLWQGADGPGVTGEYREPGRGLFRYQVSRVWEKDVDEMFNSPGMVPFMPLARFAPERLPEVVRRMKELIRAQEDPETRGNFWSLAYTCMGLRYPAETVNALLADQLPEIYARPDIRHFLSQGYYAGLHRGQADGATAATRHWILSLGVKKLGEPPAPIRQVLESMASLERLEQIAGRLRRVASWQDSLLLT